MKYCLMICVGACVASSYCAQPPIQIKYTTEDLVAYSPPGTPIPDKKGLEVILAAKKSGLSSSIDSSNEIANAMQSFCTQYPMDARIIAPKVKKQHSKSSSTVKTPDEPS